METRHSKRPRSQQQPPPAPQRQRDTDRRDFLLQSLQINPNSDNTAGYLGFPNKFRLLVKDAQWAQWSENTSKIPLYILEALFNPKHDATAVPEMEVSTEMIPREQTVIIDQISSNGAIFLQTSKGESELGFSCVVSDCISGHAMTLVGRLRPHTQYLTHLPRGMLRQEVLKKARPSVNGNYFTGDRIVFSETLMDNVYSSAAVYARVQQEKQGSATPWLSSVRHVHRPEGQWVLKRPGMTGSL